MGVELLLAVVVVTGTVVDEVSEWLDLVEEEEEDDEEEELVLVLLLQVLAGSV